MEQHRQRTAMPECAMESARLDSGLARLVQPRRYGDIRDDFLRDDDGFVTRTKDVLPVADLLQRSASFVLAPPWIGKSFVASALYRTVSLVDASQVRAPSFGQNVHLTSFEAYALSTGDPTPPWWSRWATSTSEVACWIIDALDEGEQRTPGVSSFVLSKIESLRHDARSRLTLIIFCREAEVPKDVPQHLARIYGDDLTCFQLLPLDRASAEGFLGTQALHNAIALIRKCSLQHVASYPAALRYIKRCPPDLRLTDIDVWKGVLSELLSVSNRLPNRGPEAEPETVFLAASRIAATMCFSGVDSLSAQPTPGQHTVDDIISHIPLPGQPDRKAARFALRSDMFCHFGDSIRFSQRNVQDWMAVFAIQGFTLNRARPLLTSENGRISPSAMGIARLLHRVSHCEAVRNWLTGMFGGIPPSSDAAPWSLADCIKALDHLESIACSTDWRVYIGPDDGLKGLSAPGTGAEVARRFADPKRSLLQKLLMLDVAMAIRASDCIPQASTALLAAGTDSHLRRQCAHYLSLVATDSVLQCLLPPLTKAGLRSGMDRAALADIIYALLNRGAMSAEQAAVLAPYPSEEAVDTAHLLAHHLEETMTPEIARYVVRHRTLFKGRQHTVPEGRKRYDWRREYRVDQKVIETLADQATLSDDDLRAFIGLAIKYGGAEWFHDIERPIGQAIAKVQWARRDLYVKELRRVAKARSAGKRTHRNWPWILKGEDAEWLFSLVPRLATATQDIWSEVYGLLYRPDADPRTRAKIRKHFRENLPELLRLCDKNRRHYAAQRKRWDERDQKREQEKKAEEVSIGKAVSDVLNNPRRDLQQKLWSLSWICFSDAGHGPRNLVGEWKDVESSMRQDVLSLCARALHELTPTSFPDGNTFPAVVAYEAEAFRRILTDGGDAAQVDGGMIRKWLPTFLRGSFGDRGPVFNCCLEADSRATEDVLVDAMRRESRQKEPHWMLAAYLPDAFWTESFTAAVTSIIADCTIDASYRAHALRTLCDKQATKALPLVLSIIEAGRAEGTPQHQLWVAALNAWLALDRESAWPVAAEYLRRDGKTALTSLRCLYDRDSQLRASLDSWPAEQLGDLLEMLIRHYPPKEDPRRSSGSFVGDAGDFHLRDLRQNIPWMMFERGSSDDLRVLERLAARSRSMEQEYSYIKARTGVSDFLAFAAMSEGQRRRGHQICPRLDRVVRLLDDDSYRLIRSTDDLQEVILEALSRIAATAGEHLPLLYLPREVKGVPSSRRHEEALQVYLKCRLYDLLPDKILDREAVIRYRRRQDITITAPQIDRRPATVVIEVKWSDNEEVSTSLAEQLGGMYLIPEHHTHGIYVVGWNGKLKWRREAGTTPGKTDLPHALIEALRQQAKAFAVQNPGSRIDPVVIDLAWPSNAHAQPSGE